VDEGVYIHVHLIRQAEEKDTSSTRYGGVFRRLETATRWVTLQF
jgi:hypothetical protein